MKINNKGFSLVETLIMISLTGVAVAGLSKAIEKSYVTSNVIQTQQITRNFKNSVNHVLNITDSCQRILISTNRPSDKIKEMSYLFKRPTLDNPATKQNIFKGFIETVDVTVKNPNTNIYTLNLYYQYTGKATALRTMQTKGGNACTLTDKRGCYHISCNIHYKHNPPDPPDPSNPEDSSNHKQYICKPLDCIFDDTASSVLADLCEPGQFLVGVTGNKLNDCLGCQTGETLIGTIKKNNRLEPICLKSDCPTGKVATGIVPDTANPGKFKIKCESVACDEGKHTVLLNNNSMDCRPICHGGQIFDDNNNKCKCPAGKSPDEQGNCVVSP